MKLTINNISKAYGKNIALNKFTAVLESGIYALLGPNGSGKSTLMNILTDNISADSGEIIYADESGRAENIRKLGVKYREKIGYMPQYPGLYPNFSVEQFMGYMAAVKGMDKKIAAEIIDTILSEVELIDIKKRRIGALSGGMKQRLALAQAVLGDPDILILDEPTAGLDPKQRVSIRNFISKIALNKIVIIATHVVSDIEFIADNIIMMKKGEIIDCGTPYDLIQKIDGKVYNVLCDEEELKFFQDKHRVVNISRDENSSKIVLRILAESNSIPEAFPISPSLEDYYLYQFGG
jgi:ABC-type multidrug transport system ATPase subunit